MAKKKPKCALCGRNLKGNEWKWLVDADGVEHQEKVCINERRCKMQQAKRKEIYEVPQEAKELEENGVQNDYMPSVEQKISSVGKRTRQYLEVLAAVLVFVVLIIIFCVVASGGM